MTRVVVVLLRGCEVINGDPVAITDGHSTKLHANVTELSPVLAPTVTDNPVLAHLRVSPPTNPSDFVVHFIALFGRDATVIVQDWACIDSASNWASMEYLLHY